MSLIDTLQWRYATKKMDPTKSVPPEKVDKILEAIRLTASSSGLQPYEILVITNKDIREKIKPIANNQSQITDCSHLLVFAAWDDYTVDRINAAFDLTNKIRDVVLADREVYRNKLLDGYPPRGAEINFIHTAKQAYIGLGTALIAAAEEGVDCTPMEGFNPAALDEILNLKEQSLRSVLLLPLGYRKADEDWLINLKKVRRTKESFIHWIK
ncbi:NAD(P)H-dependent oxidoreductase [Polynucleobacter sp. UK-Mo-2m-Kol15]|uniref:NAD(P)H-dependent oxidoreductase n=1 Tax=Polynucleobacter sp. UK-Mo-2m-Kol15 TaxID=2576916 RepID=UPI001C0BDD3C|nr:NAD(P)H-dependent oxidoreductase [Polynucleobacter sp. UK-Mo-2m-Kol15]MBU3576204.1 NAD(P)H-dependent oxidoreductase [Polynucleobacter sp. UK-Mo-2m-Kol15]